MTDREKTLLLNCMRENIGDATHAEDHIFRVTNAARDIAQTEQGADEEAPFCACRLHDVARREQIENCGKRMERSVCCARVADYRRAQLAGNGCERRP